MFECSSARYFDVRSITDCGTWDDAALSRYTSGFPFTVCDSTGKSFRIFSTSHLGISVTAFIQIPSLREEKCSRKDAKTQSLVYRLRKFEFFVRQLHPFATLQLIDPDKNVIVAHLIKHVNDIHISEPRFDDR